jgi:hypothetical protein
MASMICKDQAMPALYDQAVIIAECEIFLLKLRAVRVAITQGNSIMNSTSERPDQMGNDSKLIKDAVDALHDLQAKLTPAAPKNSGLDATDEHSPLPVTNRQSAQWVGGWMARSAANDVDAFLRAIPELVTLERYERRALSRRNRAIRMFDAISVVTPFLRRETKGG